MPPPTHNLIEICVHHSNLELLGVTNVEFFIGILPAQYKRSVLRSITYSITYTCIEHSALQVTLTLAAAIEPLNFRNLCDCQFVT